MGNSTISVQDTVDQISAMADVSPQAQPSGYAQNTILNIAQDTMNKLIARRFNWKWNSGNAPTFLTNSWQQDYPMLGIDYIAWLEDGLWVDINNTALPQPNGQVQSAKDLAPARTTYAGYQGSYPCKCCWMYNRQLLYGNWPGPDSIYTPLITTNVIQNGPTAFIDVNGNILLLTTFGTTGATPPAAPAKSIEGATVNDGTCVWTVCDPLGQGFRLDNLPGPTGPVYKIYNKFQFKPPKFITIDQMIDPIPDDYAHHFRTGFKAGSYAYASDPKTRSQFPAMEAEWMASMGDAEQQGDREPDSFMLYPATRIVAPTSGITRNPRDPGRPV